MLSCGDPQSQTVGRAVASGGRSGNPQPWGSAVAINAVSVVKEVWVSLTCSFSHDIMASGDVGCLYLHPNLPAAHMAHDETMCSPPCPRLGWDSLVSTFPSGDKVRSKG